MKSQVVSAVRFPTRQHRISFDSGSSATKVYWSPTSQRMSSGPTFFCFLAT